MPKNTIYAHHLIKLNKDLITTTKRLETENAELRKQIKELKNVNA